MENYRLKTKKGFTVSEVLVSVSIIGLCASIIMFKHKYTFSWAQEKIAVVQMQSLNTGVDLLKLDPELCNQLRNDNTPAVLELLGRKGLIHIPGMNPALLKSRGEGLDFQFIESNERENKQMYPESSTGLNTQEELIQEAWGSKISAENEKDINARREERNEHDFLSPEVLEAIVDLAYKY